MDKNIEMALKDAIASLKIEGAELPKGGEELILRRLRGEITEKEFLEAAAKIAKDE